MNKKRQKKIATARKLKRKLAKKQKGERGKTTRKFGKIDVPIVRHITDFKLETFKSYYARWPKTLRNIPKNVVEQWIYRHNDTFLEMWAQMKPEKWSFRRKSFSTEQCRTITHIPKEMEHYEYVGERYIKQVHERDFVANYMLEKGSFPQPIIIARGASSLIHPKGAEYNDHMTDNQLIEGHRRIGLLRAMFTNKLALKSKHKAWIMRFKT
ncbi:hypothetical protein EGH82_20770 [Vibrio ponticus]|uniref:Uncharacterized protein n=1 Tax=Vibrio ponticus TaxID=265668 RepID=A0A3N3DTV9_9VIBR|nr:hypothetical protein [Vibrio ponticus]ROV57931.1 hypothetical protein EGH82_20770 [Vibrio ponticus]